MSKPAEFDYDRNVCPYCAGEGCQSCGYTGNDLSDDPGIVPDAVVDVPGRFLAYVVDGKIARWVFVPHGGDAGYFGPDAVFDRSDRDDAEEVEGLLNVEDSDGPFWEAVRANLSEQAPMRVSWEE